jgi:YfiH family protein
VRAHVTVTTRVGGTSRPPYDTNNLALHVGDDPAAVAENRARLAASLGVDRVQFMHQVHAAEARVVTGAGSDVEGVDALVTSAAGVAVAALVADCVPVAVWGGRAVAVVHAGRRGVAAGVINAAVTALREVDDGPLRARLGPAICGRCDEVPEQMQEEVAAVVPGTRSTTRQGTSGLDLPAGVRAQLSAAGVQVDDADAPCTAEDHTFYSHRRDGVTGRFAMVAMLVG